MEKTYKIIGGKELKGKINIQGSKNAALPIIIASLLNKNKTTLNNIPNIKDVLELIEILKKLNVQTKFNNNSLSIDASNIKYIPLTIMEVQTFRASYYFIGAFLSLYGKVEIFKPGGCKIGSRPIDQHIFGLEKLGAKIIVENELIKCSIERIEKADIYLDIPSVGATINIILASLNTKEKIIINNAAKEPEIEDFVNFLNKSGFNIQGAGTSKIIIKPYEKTYKVKYKIIPDRIVAGTFLIYGSLLAKKLTIKNFYVKHNEILLLTLKSLGVKIKSKKNSIVVFKTNLTKGANITTGVYPSFPTDLQQIITVLLLYSKEKSFVTETLFENRFSFLNEIKKAGGKFMIFKNTVEIFPSNTSSSTFCCEDLRGGAALLLVCLYSKGASTLKNIKYIERGYENIINNLRKIGARIDEIVE